jgi:hypothetical protein
MYIRSIRELASGDQSRYHAIPFGLKIHAHITSVDKIEFFDPIAHSPSPTPQNRVAESPIIHGTPGGLTSRTMHNKSFESIRTNWRHLNRITSCGPITAFPGMAIPSLRSFSTDRSP